MSNFCGIGVALASHVSALAPRSSTDGWRTWYANAALRRQMHREVRGIANCAHEELVGHCTTGIPAAAIAEPSVVREVYAVQWHGQALND